MAINQDEIEALRQGLSETARQTADEATALAAAIGTAMAGATNEVRMIALTVSVVELLATLELDQLQIGLDRFMEGFGAMLAVALADRATIPDFAVH